MGKRRDAAKAKQIEQGIHHHSQNNLDILSNFVHIISFRDMFILLALSKITKLPTPETGKWYSMI